MPSQHIQTVHDGLIKNFRMFIIMAALQCNYTFFNLFSWNNTYYSARAVEG